MAPKFFSVVLVVAAAAALLSSSSSPASAQFVICGVDLTRLKNACQEFVKVSGPRIDPSAECCSWVKKSNIPCLCDNLPPGIEQQLSLAKAAYVAGKCGNPVKRGSKCGDFTFPPLA